MVTGAGSHVSGNVSALVGTGFCDALSTYSTFSYETLRLAQDGARFYPAANVAISFAGGHRRGRVRLVDRAVAHLTAARHPHRATRTS